MQSDKRPKVVHLTQTEWVLQRPASYVGSVEPEEIQCLVFDEGKPRVHRTTVSPALISLFREPLHNALDVHARDPVGLTCIKVCIPADCTSSLGDAPLTVANNGMPLPVTTSTNDDGGGATPTHPITTAFGRWQSGTNFDVLDGAKTHAHTIGQNGVGIKAVNAFSRSLRVSVQHAEDGMSFSQTWRNNMSVEEPPIQRRHKSKRHETLVEWVPDWSRLNADPTNADTRKVLEALVYHVALCAPWGVKVWLNNREIRMHSPQQFVNALEAPRPYATDMVQDSSLRMRVCVAARAEGTEPVCEAFVNGARCDGTHVQMLLQRICEIVLAKSRKRDAGAQCRPTALRGELVLIAHMTIDNAQFDSQQKTRLVTKASAFGWRWDPSDTFCAALERSDLVARTLRASRAEADAKVARDTKPTTRPATMDVPKYEPALRVGAPTVACTLIVCEGDSAKALAVAGLAVIGRERYGVFPLKGKLLNTRNVPATTAAANTEVSNLVRILGLQFGRQYDSAAIATLPYRHLLLMTDQDVDGDHIAALVLNALDSCFPTLLRACPDFVRRMATPVIRVTLPNTPSQLGFFSEVEYETWRRARVAEGAPTGRHKYYKGLGTSTAADARTYFAALEHNSIDLTHTGDASSAALAHWFDKQRAADRRAFLKDSFNPTSFVDYACDSVPIERFMYDGVSHFSERDNARSIPHVIDGLKPSQRKALFVMRERRMREDVKVAQLMGTVAERTAYHHGEASLGATIIGMACDHCFSNNVALLVPSGSFGTRHCTTDAASPRYLFTRLDPVTEYLFKAEDDAVLEYHQDDSRAIEPVFYVPVVPTVLINGAFGVGTGWRCNMPSFCPCAVVEACEDWLLAHTSAPVRIGDAHSGSESSSGENVCMVDAHECGAQAKHDEATTTREMDASSSVSSVDTPSSPLSCQSSASEGGRVAEEDGNVFDAGATTPNSTPTPMPWYRDYTGTVECSGSEYSSVGCFCVRGTEVHVTELPVNTVTEDYVAALRKRIMRTGGNGGNGGNDAPERFATRIDECSTNRRVLIIIHSTTERIRAVERLEGGVVGLLRLRGRIPMHPHLFPAGAQMRPESYTIARVVQDFASVRMKTYVLRLAHQCNEARNARLVAVNRRCFIGSVRAKTLDLATFDDESDLARRLADDGYDTHDGSYAYLMHMHSSSLTNARYQALCKDVARIDAKLAVLESTTPCALWRRELTELRGALGEYAHRKAVHNESAPPIVPRKQFDKKGKSKSARKA